MNQRCEVNLRNRRGTTRLANDANTITYHQQRNRAARLSRQKEIPRLT
jgi:hypothetical protein